MLEHGHDPFGAERVAEDPGIFRHLFRRSAVGAPQPDDHRVFGVDRQVHDRGEIGIDPLFLQCRRKDAVDLRGISGIVRVTDGRGRRGFGKTVLGFQPCDFAALLVDGDQQRRGRKRAQLRRQHGELLRGSDILRPVAVVVIAVEEDHASGPVAAQCLHERIGRIQPVGIETDDDHPADLLLEPGIGRRLRRRQEQWHDKKD